jgi:25S rRNA (uracil2634-N3)-methyltransferase
MKQQIATIYKLGVKNQMLISKCLDYRMFNEVRYLNGIDHQLVKLLGKAKGFNLVHELAQGSTLLVGEGNMSFTLSLSKTKPIKPLYLIATTYESLSELSDEVIENARKLKYAGATVIHNVDATKLRSSFGTMYFNNIVFNFPNVANREPVEGRNPNFILVREFLKSAFHQLKHGGRVYISAVDTPHYRGAFSFDEAAEFAGFHMPEVYPFDPYEFHGYNHTMTHMDEDALENHDSFATWVFSL